MSISSDIALLRRIGIFVRNGAEGMLRTDIPFGQYVSRETIDIFTEAAFRYGMRRIENKFNQDLDIEDKKMPQKIDYVKLPLNKDDIKLIWAHASDVKQVSTWINELADTGYVVRIKQGYAPNSHEAVIFPPDDSKNKGKALTGVGSQAWGALVSVLYRHFVLSGGGEWVIKEPEGAWLQ